MLATGGLEVEVAGESGAEFQEKQARVKRWRETRFKGLISEIKPEYSPPREDVILQNEAPSDLYILITGAMDLISYRNGIEQVVGEIKTGDVCGEVGVLCYRPQIFTVHTKRFIQLLPLNHTTFLNIVQANVGGGTIITNNLLQHLKEHKDSVMQTILADTEHMLAQGRMDVPLSLCFAAERGDDLLMHNLLRQNLDPNELDSNGRTALITGQHYLLVKWVSSPTASQSSNAT
ncbi:potassium channel AKT1-like [Olea europaea subsp. europaea]|uniref:Potassium channel n=1 Tax=Olea europaea subsp. europaea TaxID=158383 RepID=A0A8S0VPY3_OLEEU|nr:potassium channel AKT1-like [Olea europaea subsp. europaea]